MTALMFAVGIGLVVFAALYATFGDAAVLSVAFAGLGVSTFVAIFVVRPLDDAQNALSNLIQAEIAFMSFFEQIRMLASYAWKDGELDCARAEKASLLLHRRTAQSMALLQEHLETPRPESNGRAHHPRRRLRRSIAAKDAAAGSPAKGGQADKASRS